MKKAKQAQASTPRLATIAARAIPAALATRGAFSGVEGSGAPSARGRLALLVFALAALSLLTFSSLSEAKVVVNGFGLDSGTASGGGRNPALGGQFGSPPRGVGVNSTGNGGVAPGTAYVADGSRIQRFSPGGAFERLWGQDVVGRNERQLIRVKTGGGCPPKGSFTLGLGADAVTIPIVFEPTGGGPCGPAVASPTEATVEKALESFPSIGSGNVEVRFGGGGFGSYLVEFTGALAGTDVAQLAIDGSQLTGAPPISALVSTVENGSGGNFVGFEICTVAAACNDGLAGGFGGQLDRSEGLAVNQANGHVYVTESGNRRVSEFDADGNFVRAWGWDVDTAAGTGFEICTVAANCKKGTAGAGAGQFRAGQSQDFIGYPAIDSAGNVWVSDPPNSRIQVFDSTGNFLKMVGGDVISDGAAGTGTLTSGSETISGVTTTSRFFEVGQTITASGGGIPVGTTITGVTSDSLTLSQAATTSGSEALTVAAGAGNVPTNEKQTIALSGATGGKFTLIFDGQATGATGTGSLNYNFTPELITNVTTTSGAFVVGQIITTPLSSIPAGTTITAVNADTLTLSQQHMETGSGRDLVAHEIPPTASAATLQSKLEGLPNIGVGNVAVSGPDGGPWTVEFKGRFAGADVPQIIATNRGLAPLTARATVTSINPLEVCSIAADCRKGAPGSGAGQFFWSDAFEDLSPKIAFDSSGNLYATDSGNRRVQKFNPALTAAVNFGAATFPAYTTRIPTQVTATEGGSRLAFAVDNDVDANELQVIELDPADADVIDTSLVGSGLQSVNGLAANDASGDLYATTADPKSPRRVLVLSDTFPSDPVLAMDPIATKTATTASFKGAVDPNGGWVSCKFQYSTDQTVWTDVAATDCETLNALGGSQVVSEDVTGLNPNSHYFVRLSVSRPLAVGSTRTSTAKEFDTDPAPPTVTNVGAINPSDTSVRLVGTINPLNADTSYVFEYGTTPAFGSSTAPVNVGSGLSPLTISQVVEGLSPSTTYHFALVATNEAGPTTSATGTFTTRADAVLPDNRRYEQVSPANKNFGGVDFSPLPNSAVAPDGEAAGYCTASGFPTDPPAQVSGACSNYVSRRNSDGWRTKALNPPMCSTGNVFLGAQSIPTLNLDYSIVSVPLQGDYCPTPPLDPSAPTTGQGFGFYRQNLLTDPSTFQSLAPAPVNIGVGRYEGVKTSDDASHVVYKGVAQQTPDAPAGNFDKIFDWHDGELSLVSKNTVNQPFKTNSAVPANAINGVSASGDRIFFQNPFEGGGGCKQNNCELYLREGGSKTYRASQQECTPACPEADAPDIFQWATPDGSKAVFRTAAKLVNEDAQAGIDLYLYTHSDDPAADKNLTLLSVDSEPGDGLNADVEGVLGISDDADTVYFVANGQLELGGPTDAGPKIYRWLWNGGSPTVDYLGTLEAQASAITWESAFTDYPVMRLVTPDGKHLLLQTIARLEPIADQDSTRDIYRWSEAGGWICASCQPPGSPSAGNSSIQGTDLTGLAVATSTGLMNQEQRILMSDNGKRIFFTTHDALAAGDSNGSVEDVYEWHDGAVSLISGGHDTKEVMLLASSRSGSDVFFITFEKLVGWDVDANSDVYDARIGGGFPEPPATGAPCEGEACRGAGTGAPPATGAGTAAFQGPGNPKAGGEGKPKPRCPKGKHKVNRKGKARCVKTKGKDRGAKHKASANRRVGR